MTVKPEWIDHNNHLNMAYYNVLFDQCADEIFAQMGFGPDYIAARGMTTYTAEFHLCYVRELHVDDPVRVSFQMLDMDEKRFHAYQEIHHQDGWLAATAEGVTLHVDTSGPRVAVMPDDILAKVRGVYDAHSTLPRPERAGRSVGIRRR